MPGLKRRWESNSPWEEEEDRAAATVAEDVQAGEAGALARAHPGEGLAERTEAATAAAQAGFRPQGREARLIARQGLCRDTGPRH